MMARDSVVDAFVGTLWKLLFGPVGRLLPFGICRYLAVPIGSLAWVLGVRRSISLYNLRLAFPERSMRELKRIGRESWVNLVTVFLEMTTLRFLSDDELRRRISVENLDLLRAGGSGGQLLLSGHFGNWELLAFGAAALAHVPFSIVVTEQKDYGQLTRMRTARGNRLIPTGRGARESTSLLRAGGAVAMLADQAATPHDDLVTMFGIPTYSFAAPARMALRFRPAVIVGFAVRQASGGYHVRLQQLPHDDLADRPDKATILTQRYVALLEAAIREHPEQWVWHHRKWKNTPGVDYNRGGGE